MADERRPAHWWNDKKRSKPIHEAVFDWVRFIEQHQIYKRDDNLRHMRLFGNLPLLGLSPSTFAISDQSKKNRARVNIIQAIVNTATAREGTKRPRPRPVTEGGDYRRQKQAKAAEKFIQGVIYDNKGHTLAKRAYRDGGIFGTGVMKVISDFERMKVVLERVLIDDLRFDDAECKYGMPRSMAHVHTMPRATLMEMYPELESKIVLAPAPKEGPSVYQNLADYVEVVEAWHLASGPDAKDGRYVRAIANATLEDEPYKLQRFPFAPFHWTDPVVGFTGHGAAENLTGLQVSINIHLRTIEQALGLLGVPRVFVEDSGDVVVSQINNEIGAIIRYASGTNPPVVSAPSVIPPDLREQLLWYIQMSYELEGLSRLSAHGEKPVGLNAAVALREQQDIESERAAERQQNFEEMMCELGELILEAGRELYAEENGKKLSVMVPGRRAIEEVRFADLNLEDLKYTMQIFPTSMLPKTPAGKFQQIDEWIQGGYITKEEGMRLMDMPDLEEANALYNAAIEDIDSLIDDFIFGEPTPEEAKQLKGIDDEYELEMAKADFLYRPPDPMQNLQLGMKRMNASYLRYRNEKVPEPRLDLLIRWMDEASELMAPPQAAAPAAPAPMPGEMPMDPALAGGAPPTAMPAPGA